MLYSNHLDPNVYTVSFIGDSTLNFSDGIDCNSITNHCALTVNASQLQKLKDEQYSIAVMASSGFSSVNSKIFPSQSELI